jgi:hypothetical protein
MMVDILRKDRVCFCSHLCRTSINVCLTEQNFFFPLEERFREEKTNLMFSAQPSVFKIIKHMCVSAPGLVLYTYIYTSYLLTALGKDYVCLM